VQQLPAGAMASLTWDRGSELAQHKRFTVATEVIMYFCDPRSPWQRGTNENTNRLLRQYFPKGTDLSQYTQQHLDEIALKLNTRPRKTLGFGTPGEKFNQGVAPVERTTDTIQADSRINALYSSKQLNTQLSPVY
jgi:IS30 family transposase